MMNTAAPIWDGNETWLVLGGGGLFAAFPLAYSVVLSGVVSAVLVMLLGLVFRGVAFEFRFKATRRSASVGACFAVGRSPRRSRKAWCSARSWRASRSREANMSAAPFGWFRPFSMVTGVAVLSATRCSAAPG